VDDKDLFRGDAVELHDPAFGVMADGDDRIGLTHSPALDFEDVAVDVLAAAVVFQGVDVENQGFPAAASCPETGEDTHPVVGVDDVEGPFDPDGACNHPIADHLRKEVRAVLPGQVHQGAASAPPRPRGGGSGRTHIGAKGRTNPAEVEVRREAAF